MARPLLVVIVGLLFLLVGALPIAGAMGPFYYDAAWLMPYLGFGLVLALGIPAFVVAVLALIIGLGLLWMKKPAMWIGVIVLGVSALSSAWAGASFPDFTVTLGMSTVVSIVLMLMLLANRGQFDQPEM